MYSLRFSKTYGFGIVEENNLQQVIEDKFFADDNVFCVADGVTRDLVDGTPLKYPKTLEEAQRIIKNYPAVSGAAIAAELCVNDVVESLKTEEKHDLKEILKHVNQDIEKINHDRNIDYLNQDEYCCTAVGGFFTKDYLECFAIGDSGIKVLDKDYNVIFDSTVTLKEGNGIFDATCRKLLPSIFSWDKKWYRSHARKNSRNNLWLKYTGQRNVGVLNGQKKAMHFIKTYKIPLEKAHYILAFSDGCMDYLKTKKSLEKTIKNPETIRYDIHEKTLIIYEKTM